MNVLRMKKPELISELEKRSLPTNGLKDELVSRLMEAVERENFDDNGDKSTSDTGDNEENLKSDVEEDKNDQDCTTDVDINTIGNNETLNENETVIDADPSANITVEDSIKMKAPYEVESDSTKVIVIEDDDEDDSISNSPNNNVNPVQTINNYNRELDNGDHEVIEINEEVVIDDDDNQENVTNYNDISSDSNQLQSRHVEKIELRKDDVTKPPVKTEIWISNIAEDVKAVELKELFGKYGKVISAKVVMNAKNPSGSCYGCIQLASSDDAKLCIMNLDQTDFRGNIITISNEFTEKAPKEKATRQPSPASSTASWGSKKNVDKEAKQSSPILSQPTNKGKPDTTEKDKRPPYREKPNTGGNYYKPRDFTENRGGGSFNRRGGGANRTNYDDRKRNFPDKPPAGRPYYSKPNTGGYSGGNGGNSYNAHDGNRGRDMMARRDNYNPPYESSRYGASSMPARDRPIGRTDYQDKFKPSYEYRGRPDKYDAYDEYDRRDRRSGPGNSGGSGVYDRGGRSDMGGGYLAKRLDMYPKRTRPEDEDDFLHSKRRRPDPVIDRSHYYRAVDSPRKSSGPYYHPDKEFRKPDYKPVPRRDEYMSSDYSNSAKTDRDFFPMRRAPVADYSSARRDTYEVYTPPDRHLMRSAHYNKDPYVPQHSTDFGGRSRRY